MEFDGASGSKFVVWFHGNRQKDPFHDLLGVWIQVNKNTAYPAMVLVNPFNFSTKVNARQIMNAKGQQRKMKPKAVVGLVLERPHNFNFETTEAEIE